MREITYCLNCGGKTGYGFGVEPKRFDTVCCSSKCLKVLEKDFFRYYGLDIQTRRRENEKDR